MSDMLCVLHLAAPTMTVVPPATTIVFGLAVCATCLGKILDNERASLHYSAEEYLHDALWNQWL
jgi:hypothetical protein